MNDIFKQTLSVLFLFSCHSRTKETIDTGFVVIPIGGKLSKLLSMPRDTILDYYDLSNDFLTDPPDLSEFTIKSLNLSHNYMDSIILRYLPKGIENLDASYNCLRQFPAERDVISGLKVLNISHNNLITFFLYIHVEYVNVSYNRLSYVLLAVTYPYLHRFGKTRLKRITFLDISNNPILSKDVWLNPAVIDTIVYHNIGDDKQLQYIDWPPRTKVEYFEEVIPTPADSMRRK